MGARSLPNVPDAKFYRVEVSHRGEVTFEHDQLKRNGWLVFLSVG